MRVMSLEKHLLQQVRRSKFQIEITDYKSRRTVNTVRGVIYMVLSPLEKKEKGFTNK